jgi:hypothetical protein
MAERFGPKRVRENMDADCVGNGCRYDGGQ